MTVLPALRSAVAAGTPAVLVRVAEALGSTPRETDAAMLVTANAAVGTVGGGRLELMAIDEARAMVAEGRGAARLDVPLGPAIGQCCGGRVRLELARADGALLAAEEAREAERLKRLPAVLVFGAGHTGQALARALMLLPFRTGVVDTRPERLADLPQGLDARALAVPEEAVAKAEPGTAYVVVTHDHALDFLIAEAALARGDAAYVGMIGSATKRATFLRRLREAGRESLIAGLTLPIGGSALRDKRPEVIAALTVAELAQVLLAKREENVGAPLAKSKRRCNSGQTEGSTISASAAPHAT
ncbi:MULTISPECIES: xanthine dehydrogenase accessory protein XdhC [unclassified Aureimonas]|uniref:xanthine dehydrogenase accessory protein XdhC n=1 Tax=unclassified Aureimonas TaxID=2615206 RepID=UPI0006F8861C|nr:MULTISPECIES: xanthine dehydrogenase accessory protein XdhC [unclassified Aureimonas]KQT69952.1 xanthine dehydrogenase accessory protein XdhC [Aureimonas sp. Leaf427]KQT75892.1 xanthine dehydrogenase accessory protein XdhC [Aureimonas sp. Leaf460]